jgi:cell division septal protein FtsQ
VGFDGMKNKERERQSRYRNTKTGKAKTPLTFYRSSDPDFEPQSPFKGRDDKNTSRKLASFFYGFIEWVVFLGLVSLLAYSLVIRPSSVVEVNSELFHQKSTYQDAANNILKGVKYSNKITFEEQGVISKLQKQFPEIANASVELPIFAQTPIIHLQVASPSFVLNSNNQSYIIDSAGVAVAKASDFPSFHSALTVEDQSGFNAVLGQQEMSEGAVNFIKTIERQTKHGGVTISSLVLPKAAQELELHTADRAYFVKFYLGGDAMQQAGQYLATRHQLDAQNSQPAEYIDVRVPGKIFYK